MTVKDRVIIYDLDKAKTSSDNKDKAKTMSNDNVEPQAINEIPAMLHMLDCQSYVETGIRFNYV